MSKSEVTKRAFGVYVDSKCTKSVYDRNLKEPLIEMKTLVEAGTSHTEMIYLRNESKDDFIITRVDVPEDVSVKIASSRLKPMAITEMQVIWSPKKEDVKALFDDVVIRGYYEIRALM